MRQRNSRKGKVHHGDSKDRWLITYADLITLLLIFFILMFAMSRIDAEKYKVITRSLQHTFKNGDSILEKGSGITGSADVHTFKNPPTTEISKAKDGADELSERELAFRKQEEQLKELMKMIEQYIQLNKLESKVFVSDEPKGIMITLSDQFLFDQGKADLKPVSEPTLKKLASLFAKLDATISIEGHTDNLPIVYASKYKDNWELSGARALSVLRYFIDHEKLDPTKFQYAGYADTHPASDNSTEQGRQKNRRVEIIVLRQLQK
ncbi:flagellar motor protein MotB [Paenibacillus sediminis]|uniref:Chemotaxis protein MotB n=1 Tax=Paenibacillus sediminis TaxID=664909 RepID=A0ABS4H2C9_9BACL|nr:flagellar motor protein MotB [Paenibacillus sediminis]MBP1936621.1 chemotaxis protein MotB [Paenibacillus sediminis]